MISDNHLVLFIKKLNNLFPAGGDVIFQLSLAL